MKGDLHLHSTASDGALTPSELMRWAKDSGLEAVALTDHDAVDGIEEAEAAAKQLGIKFVRGIEISSYSVCEIHVLGYNMRIDAGFEQELREIKDMRRARNEEIGLRLKALGISPDIDFSADGIGRMNMARALVAGGYCADVNAAFEKYLGVRGKAYVEAKRITPFAAVSFINKYGGFACLAHPKKYLLDKRLEMLIGGLKKYGLRGLEVNYPGHSESDIKELNALCDRYGLLPTSGSDYHGDEDKHFVCALDRRTERALRIGR